MRARYSITFMILIALVLTLSGQSAAQERNKNEDLVIIEYERWIDTIKGSVKNFNSAVARDLTIVVTFRSEKGGLIGRQTEPLGDLDSGESISFNIKIQARHTKASRFGIRPIAIWPSDDKP